jgi:hypothetical protein
MVKYNDWGQHLRLGNWLFLYAGLQSILKNTDNELWLPDYFLWNYLEYPPHITHGNTYHDEIFHFRQTNYTLEEKEYLINYFSKNKDKQVNINLGSHLQSELWFKNDLETVIHQLKIKQEEIDKVKEKYAPFFERETIGIGIRRGDFVNHGCFYQIPEKWYEEALYANFPNYNNYNVIVFSDDIEWCKQYYQGKEFLFAEPNNTHTHADNFKHYRKDPMEQFILGILCNNFIGGSSTFTWWQMWYVKNFNDGKVVHSGKNLIGNCAQNHFNPDYYPDNWTLYQV